MRHDEDSLTATGFMKRFSCEAGACSKSGQRIQDSFIDASRAMTQVECHGGDSSMVFKVVDTSADTH